MSDVSDLRVAGEAVKVTHGAYMAALQWRGKLMREARIAGMTLDQIAEAVGVTRAAVIHYFKSCKPRPIQASEP